MSDQLSEAEIRKAQQDLKANSYDAPRYCGEFLEFKGWLTGKGNEPAEPFWGLKAAALRAKGGE